MPVLEAGELKVTQQQGVGQRFLLVGLLETTHKPLLCLVIQAIVEKYL